MKKLTVLFFFLAAPAVAQEVCVDDTYCHTATADQVAAQVELKADHNAAVCASVGLPGTCTQAEYESAGGSGETVYTSNADGTRLFFRDRVAIHLEADADARRQRIARRLEDYIRSLSAAAKSAACVTLGLTETCEAS